MDIILWIVYGLLWIVRHLPDFRAITKTRRVCPFSERASVIGTASFQSISPVLKGSNYIYLFFSVQPVAV